jgi:hypothetical protein
MSTYWLVDSSRMYERTPMSMKEHLPGQTDRVSVVSASAQPGTSQGRQIDSDEDVA